MTTLIGELDWYRLHYDELSFAEHREMYERIDSLYPEQSFWNAADCIEFVRHFEPKNVVEVGGHDGGLAGAVLAEVPEIVSWTNLELTEATQVCTDPRYRLVLLEDWWLGQTFGDAVVLSHVVEHLSVAKLRELVVALLPHHPDVYVDAPLPESGGVSWWGTETAHVLPFSMAALDALFVDYGWRQVHAAESVECGFPCRTRWYQG